MLASALALGVAAAAAPPDADGAATQYQLAQRLAAERSPDAAPAFEKAVAMAPSGPLADDALVGLARAQGALDWPEDLARLDASHAARAATTLVKLLELSPPGDRAPEGRYLLALVRLAPVAARDAVQSKHDLIALAAEPKNGTWAARARYTLGTIAEQEGALDRAAGAFARIVVEGSDEDEVELRARAGFARTLLASGRFGEAALWLQPVVDAGPAGATGAGALRALAVRELLREREAGRKWSATSAPVASVATTRGARLLATSASGGFVVYDRKNETLQLFDAKGSGAPPVPAPGVTALATDPFRRVWVAAGDTLSRLEGARLVPVASLGPFKEPAAIAADAGGSVWLADRRGDRIGRVSPDAKTAVVVREAKGAGITALVVAHGRLIAAEADLGRLVELTESGPERPFGPPVRKPAALAVDPAGRITVLDEKTGTLLRLSASGALLDTLDLAPAGVSKPLAVAAADDGAARVLDGSTGNVAVAP
jgi:streptogramin lyase